MKKKTMGIFSAVILSVLAILLQGLSALAESSETYEQSMSYEEMEASSL